MRRIAEELDVHFHCGCNSIIGSVRNAVNDDIYDEVEDGKERNSIRWRLTHPSCSIYCANYFSMVDREWFPKCVAYTFELRMDGELAIDDGIS